jgi:hypothetical protein
LDLVIELKERNSFDYYYKCFDWLKKKMDGLNISPCINFEFLKKLRNIKHLFNNLNISRDKNVKEKWFSLIEEEIPEILLVLNEEHWLFDYFKSVIISFL